MFSTSLVAKGVTFVAADDNSCCFCWSRCPLDVISDSGIYFEMIFSVSPGHVAKDQYLISLIRVHFSGQKSS